VRGLKQVASEMDVEVNSKHFDPVVVVKEIFLKRQHILRSLQDDVDALKRGEMRTESLSVTDAEGLPSFVFVTNHGEHSLGQRLERGSTKITKDDRYAINLIKAIDTHITHTWNGIDVVSLSKLCEQLASSTAGYTYSRLADVCKEFNIDFTELSDPQDTIEIIYNHRVSTLKKAKEDQNRSAHGYQRTTALAITNPEGLPDFIFVAKRDPLALGERLKLGCTEVTPDDRYVIKVLENLDNLVQMRLDHDMAEKSLSSIDDEETTSSLMDLTKALELFCMEHLSEEAGCSKHRLRLAAVECLVPLTDLNSMTNSEIIRAMYNHRLSKFRNISDKTEAGILQMRLGKQAGVSEVHVHVGGEVALQDLVPGVSVLTEDNKDECELSLQTELGPLGSAPHSRIGSNQSRSRTRALTPGSRAVSPLHLGGPSEDEECDAFFLTANTTPDRHSTPLQVFMSPIQQGRQRDGQRQRQSHSHTHSHSQSNGERFDNDDDSIDPKQLTLPNVADTSMDSFDLLRLTRVNSLGGRKASSVSSDDPLTAKSMRSVHMAQSQHHGLIHYSEELDPLRADHKSDEPGIYMYDRASKSTSKLKSDRVMKCGVTIKSENLCTEHEPSAEHALLWHNDAPHVPWVPKGGLKLMVSDKTDVLLNWRERKEVGLLHDDTKQRCVVKRQSVVRESFENYARHSRKQQVAARVSAGVSEGGVQMWSSYDPNKYRTKKQGSRAATSHSQQRS
jgi:hypothetical protein